MFKDANESKDYTTQGLVDFHHQVIAHAGRNRVVGYPLIE